MEITQDIANKAILYRREGLHFIRTSEAEAPTNAKEIEGTLIGIKQSESGAYPYTMYLSSPAIKGKTIAEDTIAGVEMKEEEARVVFSAIIGTISLTTFPKSPRLNFRIPGFSRSIEIRFSYLTEYNIRNIILLCPTDITNKEVTAAAVKLINTALLREKYPFMRNY